MGKFRYATINGLSLSISDATSPEAHSDALFYNELGKYTRETVIHINGFSSDAELNKFCAERGYEIV